MWRNPFSELLGGTDMNSSRMTDKMKKILSSVNSLSDIDFETMWSNAFSDPLEGVDMNSTRMASTE
jgi:hypothetical protein